MMMHSGAAAPTAVLGLCSTTDPTHDEWRQVTYTFLTDISKLTVMWGHSVRIEISTYKSK